VLPKRRGVYQRRSTTPVAQRKKKRGPWFPLKHGRGEENVLLGEKGKGTRRKKPRTWPLPNYGIKIEEAASGKDNGVGKNHKKQGKEVVRLRKQMKKIVLTDKEKGTSQDFTEELGEGSRKGKGEGGGGRLRQKDSCGGVFIDLKRISREKKKDGYGMERHGRNDPLEKKRKGEQSGRARKEKRGPDTLKRSSVAAS